MNILALTAIISWINGFLLSYLVHDGYQGYFNRPTISAPPPSFDGPTVQLSAPSSFASAELLASFYDPVIPGNGFIPPLTIPTLQYQLDHCFMIQDPPVCLRSNYSDYKPRPLKFSELKYKFTGYKSSFPYLDFTSWYFVDICREAWVGLVHGRYIDGKSIRLNLHWIPNLLWALLTFLFALLAPPKVIRFFWSTTSRGLLNALKPVLDRLLSERLVSDQTIYLVSDPEDQKRRERLEKQVEDLIQSVDLLAQENKSLKSQVDSSNEHIESHFHSVHAIREDLAATQKDLASTRKDLASTQNDSASTQKDLASTKKDLVFAQHTLASVQQELTTNVSQKDFDYLRKELHKHVKTTHDRLQDCPKWISDQVDKWFEKNGDDVANSEAYRDKAREICAEYCEHVEETWQAKMSQIEKEMEKKMETFKKLNSKAKLPRRAQAAQDSTAPPMSSSLPIEEAHSSSSALAQAPEPERPLANIDEEVPMLPAPTEPEAPSSALAQAPEPERPLAKVNEEAPVPSSSVEEEEQSIEVVKALEPESVEEDSQEGPILPALTEEKKADQTPATVVGQAPKQEELYERIDLEALVPLTTIPPTLVLRPEPKLELGLFTGGSTEPPVLAPSRGFHAVYEAQEIWNAPPMDLQRQLSVTVPHMPVIVPEVPQCANQPTPVPPVLHRMVIKPEVPLSAMRPTPVPAVLPPGRIFTNPFQGLDDLKAKRHDFHVDIQFTVPEVGNTIQASTSLEAPMKDVELGNNQEMRTQHESPQFTVPEKGHTIQALEPWQLQIRGVEFGKNQQVELQQRFPRPVFENVCNAIMKENQVEVELARRRIARLKKAYSANVEHTHRRRIAEFKKAKSSKDKRPSNDSPQTSYEVVEARDEQESEGVPIFFDGMYQGTFTDPAEITEWRRKQYNNAEFEKHESKNDEDAESDSGLYLSDDDVDRVDRGHYVSDKDESDQDDYYHGNEDEEDDEDDEDMDGYVHEGDRDD